MIINQFDLGPIARLAPVTTGPLSTNAGSLWGQYGQGEPVYGGREVYYTRGGTKISRHERIWVENFAAIGGSAAGTQQGFRYLMRQLQELAGNFASQPVYIQWRSGAGTITADADDGWWIIDSLTPSFELEASAWGTIDLAATLVAPALNPLGYFFAGGVFTTNYVGTGVNVIALPLGSTALLPTLGTNGYRVSAEGQVSLYSAPVADPAPFLPSATIATMFTGQVRVYDTLNTSSNAVPTSGGTYVNANWVEVFGSVHNFTGDCVVTNGLTLLLFAVGAAQVATCYLWSTGLATANWQQYGLLSYGDNAGGADTLRSYELIQVGPEESVVQVTSSTTTPNVGRVTVGLQRGHYEADVIFSPQSEASTGNLSLSLTLPATPKVIWNPTHVADVVLSETSPAFDATYGYGAALIASTAQPFIAGFLYQNKPASQPYNSGNVAVIGLGDTSSLAIKAQRTYGIFAVPYGVSGSYSPANLQAEGEGGTLGTGWSSLADAAASAGNTAKCASGTASTNADLFGTAFTPDPGLYDCWFRVRVTSAASNTAQMQLGLWDVTAGAFVAAGQTTYKPNQSAVTYAWLQAGIAFTPTAGHSMRFRAVTTATLGTDWFIDEAVLVPASLSADNRGPRDLWQQFLYDQSVRLTRY